MNNKPVCADYKERDTMNMQLQLLVGVIEYSDLELTCDIYQTE
jgi:hypothetical protein